MFVARDRELGVLDDAYRSGAFEMVVVYGRRRIGKTRLIGEFASGKARVHLFSARETTPQDNLAALSRSLLEWCGRDAQAGFADAAPAPVFASFADAFERAFAEAEGERTVLVIDEYPYLAKSYPGVSSILQSLIDARKASSKLMLVLCGSSTSFMRRQVLGEKSPLYGRRTAQIELAPFDYLDANKLLQAGKATRALELYGLVGGVPLYLEQLDGRRTCEWNMAEKMLGLGRFLFAEPENFMLQELQSPASYNAIIDAIAHGRPRPSEIADATGIAPPNVNEYLKTLIELGIVRKDTPVGNAKRKTVVYRLTDNLFRFSHTFVPRYGTAIETGMGGQVAKRIAQREYAGYMGHVFEEVCRQWLARRIAQGGFDLLPSRVGSWWGADPAAREQVDVDVVALGSEQELVAGECKWRSEKVDADVLEELQHRATLVVDRPSRIDLVLFSKSGFTKRCERRAVEAGNVSLVTPDDMLSV